MYNSNWCIKTIHFFEQNFGHYLVLSYGYSLRDIEFFMNFFFQIVKTGGCYKTPIIPAEYILYWETPLLSEPLPKNKRVEGLRRQKNSWFT